MRTVAVFPVLLLLLASLPLYPQGLAQLLEKAPPGVEESLRATIDKFYQAHVEGKFRQADEMVAEDSKDVFFAAEKRRCRSFEILKLKYSDNFTRATAVVACDTEMTMPMGGRVQVKMPLTSLWKQEGGRWWWYVPPPNPNGEKTPFGLLNSGPEGRAPAMTPVDPATVSRMVKADRQEVVLDAAHLEGEVVITNRMPGSVSLILEYATPSPFKAALDRANLNTGESATLSIKQDPAAKSLPAKATVNVVVRPTQQVIPIQIRFGHPS